MTLCLALHHRPLTVFTRLYFSSVRLTNLLHLPDGDVVDGPERLGESSRVAGDVVRARSSKSRAGSITAPDTSLASPVTAEGDVEDNVVLVEVVIDGAAVVTVELGRWGSPSGGGRGSGSDVGGDGSTVPGPDLDGIGGPLHNVDTTVSVVEGITVRGGTGVNTATVVGVSGVAVGSGGGRALDGTIVGDGAASGGVEGDDVGGLGVDTLDDINLTVVGPVSTDGPEGGPRTAVTAGHVVKVKDEETVGESLLGDETDGLTTVGRVHGGRVGSHVDLAVNDASKAGSVGGGLVDILDRSVGRIGVGEEVPGLEEVRLIVGDNVLVGLGRRDTSENGGSAGGNGELGEHFENVCIKVNQSRKEER